MSDYIKRESIRDMYSCLDPNARVLVGQVLIDIDAIPTIHLVRCKDCIFADKDKEAEMCRCLLVSFPLWNRSDHFCSDGKRGDGNEID